jgi:hypothetical protein
MDRQARTGDTELVKSREMTGWSQTLPWWLVEEGVKTTENKIQRPPCQPLFAGLLQAIKIHLCPAFLFFEEMENYLFSNFDCSSMIMENIRLLLLLLLLLLLKIFIYVLAGVIMYFNIFTVLSPANICRQHTATEQNSERGFT